MYGGNPKKKTYSKNADRRGAAGRCSTAVRGVPGSNHGSGVNVVPVWSPDLGTGFSISSLFLVTAVWDRQGKGEPEQHKLVL